MNLIARILHRKHWQDDWLGDRWEFLSPEGEPVNKHFRKYRCECGAIFEEERDWAEYGRIVAQ